MGAGVDEYRLGDGVVYCQGSICSTPGLTHGEVITKEPHNTLSMKQFEALHEHEGQQMVDFVYRRVSILLAVSRCWDNSFHYVVWQEQGRLARVGQILDTWGPPIVYILGLDWMGSKQRQPVRSGTCDLLVWLGESKDSVGDWITPLIDGKGYHGW